MNYSSRVNYICITVAIGGLLFGFDTAAISGAIGLVKIQFNLNPAGEGWMVSCGLLGCIIGVFGTGMLTNKVGRKKSILLSALMFLFSGLGCAFTHSFSTLVIARMIGGMGVGMASVIAPMYISEFAPAQKRGRMVAYYQFAITAGILLAYFSNAFVLNYSKEHHGNLLISEPWRMMFLVMCLPSLMMLMLLGSIPESPRWLVSVKQFSRAGAILGSVRPPDAAVLELQNIRSANEDVIKRTSSLFSPSMRRPLLTGMLLAVLQQFSGINAVIYYGPSIFQSAHIDISNSLLFQVIIGSVNLLFTIIAIVYVDKFGRKFLLKAGLTGIVLSLIVCGYLFFSHNTGGVFLLILMLIYIACFAFSIGPITWIIINEIFPSHIRVKAVSLCTLTLWIAVWVVGQFFPWLIENVGPAFTFWIFAGFSLINLVFSTRVLQETKGKTLEESDMLFVNPH